MKKWMLSALVYLFCVHSYGEDIELYIGDQSQRVGKKPQVLIIFDNSGSMNTIENVKSPYDPNTTYPAIGGYNSLSDDFIYFEKQDGPDAGTPVPDSPSETRRFLSAINSCDTAREKLATVGRYTGYIREYSFQGQNGSWQELPDNNGANIKILDCFDDIQLLDPDNAGVEKNGGSIEALPDGYPVDGLGTKQNPVYYTADVNASNTAFGAGSVVTLYTDNYLRWSQSEIIDNVDLTRLEIAKDTVTDLIESAPSVDFGLQIFNYNFPGENTRDGGRIVMGIQEMTATVRQNLVDLIDVEIDGETNTPLCESLYEVSRYLGGKSVDFGDNDSNNGATYKGNTPPRDTSIESSGNYISPYRGCSNEVFVILITDGEPTEDRAADGNISGLPGIGGLFQNNYLPSLAQWMHNNDVNDSMDGEQISTLFTVGFGKDAESAEELLSRAAELGGGQYYPATDPNDLLASLQSALLEILSINTSFTAPSVASNNFDRTETLDSVYYAMFLPDQGPRWQGNLKKLKVTASGLVDREGKVAISSNGNILTTAKTFWSTSAKADGEDVEAGGVAEMLRAKTDRVIYSDLGSSGALVPFNRSNSENHFGGSANLAVVLNVDEQDIDDTINWSKGMDVDDSDLDGVTSDIRFDVFADPLHSKPLVVNYGGSSTNQDVRILLGTNAGVLHMFDDNGDSVDESWAFMPKEFFPNIKPLRENNASSGKVYGIDGSPVVYLLDKNGDGSISSSNGDKAWVFFGLRRGGSSYYGLDITLPDAPKLLWHLDAGSAGFNELGQSWSQPQLGYSKLNTSSGVPQPVLIFGGGYAISKDNSGVGGSDSVGRAIYMVDAKTGTLKWSLTPAASSGVNTQFTGIADSIPAAIGTLDSDGDGLIDRLYAGDSGGNLWRVDMPEGAPNSSENPWTVFKLAQLGGETNSTDRRFFSQPAIVRAFIEETKSSSVTDEQSNTTTVISRQETPYEAILIGSGDRSTPSSGDTEDKFFMIKDPDIFTQSFVAEDVPAPYTIESLYDYTDDPFGQTLTSQERESLALAVSQKSGWFIDFAGLGEKSMSAATAIAGVAYFNSFTPGNSSSSSCELNAGNGLLYAVDLSLGTKIYDWRTLSVGERVPDTPTIIIPPEDDDETHSRLLFVGVGEGSGAGTLTLCDAKDCCNSDCDPEEPPDGISLKTMRTYLYVAESK
ncbi:PilC/PilY family type IV pilus protein [Thalassomonas sp. RHCl1]|uniref:pilus assembly protein n=1 Tax=Thalassomonas sp. RHCl1 TaxID=2995320 RepID=UPI00248BD5EA|nr:PilC/PilY family type IV pilus protein [Thalassomonas sp. RHCl1]